MVYEENIIDLHICLKQIEENTNLLPNESATASSDSTTIEYKKDEDNCIRISQIIINDKEKPKLKNIIEMYINENF